MELSRDIAMERALNRELGIAEQQRDAGMARALSGAERAVPGWSSLAYAFLCRFAEHRVTFISEDVSDAAKGPSGLPYQPPTDRAWGPVYVRAVRAGVIAHAGVGRSRRRHASVTILWASNRYTGKR